VLNNFLADFTTLVVPPKKVAWLGIINNLAIRTRKFLLNRTFDFDNINV
jgi:hypothetical protein